MPKTMRPHKWPRIMAAMDRNRVGREEIASAIHIAPNTWTAMSRGDSEPTITQAYAILAYLKLEPDISKYFPKEE